MFATAYNRTAGPVVIDGEGRTIGGRLWGTVETTDVHTSAHLEAGRLVLVDAKPRQGQDPAARGMLEHTKLVGSRAGRLGKLDKDRLVELAAEHHVADVDAAGETLHKPELAARLAMHLEVDVPSASSTRSSTSDDDAPATTEES